MVDEGVTRLARSRPEATACKYVRIRKGFVGKRPRTWASLSAKGRGAFQAHVAALQEIVARAGSSGPQRP